MCLAERFKRPSVYSNSLVWLAGYPLSSFFFLLLFPFLFSFSFQFIKIKLLDQVVCQRTLMCLDGWPSSFFFLFYFCPCHIYINCYSRSRNTKVTKVTSWKWSNVFEGFYSTLYGNKPFQFAGCVHGLPWLTHRSPTICPCKLPYLAHLKPTSVPTHPTMSQNVHLTMWAGQDDLYVGKM